MNERDSDPLADPYKVLQVAPNAEQEVIHAAFRALAMKYHPDRDQSRFAARRMAELNRAYAVVRDPEERGRFDREARRAKFSYQRRDETSVGAPLRQAPPRASSAGTRLEFGRYEGWTLRDLARHDPDYLRWLSRHA
jgi:curved DNA-binding protein CbpA